MGESGRPESREAHRWGRSPEWTPEAYTPVSMAGWVSRFLETRWEARKMVESRKPESRKARRWGRSLEWTPEA